MVLIAFVTKHIFSILGGAHTFAAEYATAIPPYEVTQLAKYKLRMAIGCRIGHSIFLRSGVGAGMCTAIIGVS